MSVCCRDPAIKLFWKTIALPWPSDGGGGDEDMIKDTPTKETTAETNEKYQEEESPSSEEKNETVMVSAVETQKLSSDDQETKARKQSDCEEQQEQQQGNEVSEKVVLKKQDKILPCPRCNSMDTKFCYYNNYNVNQPRHFCKKCQRYWTAGGTMRNVPVGAGRRKNKNSAAAAHYHHLTCMSDPIPVGLIHHHHSTHLNPTGNGSGNIRTDLSFGSDTPLCDSMASVLKFGGKTVMNSGFPYPAEQIEEQSTGLSLTASNSNSADERTGTNLFTRASN